MNLTAFYFKISALLSLSANIVLGLLLGYYLTNAVLAYARPIPQLSTKPDVELPTQVTTLTQVSAVNADSIISAYLFGQAPRQHAPKPQPALQQDVPETKLNLKLQGVLHSDNQVEALALIRLDNGKSAVLGVGAPIHDKPNAPQIYAIYADKVIIRRNGRYETLSLAGTDSKQQKQLIQRSQASPAVPSARQSNNSGKLAQYRRQIMQNPGNLAQYIRMQPAKQNGQFIGYILRPGREAGVLQEFGLQSGDIVTAVNGIVLDSAFKMEALQQLSEASSVNLQILRNGSSLSMNLSVAP